MRTNRLHLFLVAIPAWVALVVGAYLWSRPRDSTRQALHTLEIGALPVT